MVKEQTVILRIVRICSRTEARDQRLVELKNLLLSKDYKAGIIDAAIAKAKAIPREEALKKVERTAGSSRPVFVIHFSVELTLPCYKWKINLL